jgi:hypothetical protein
MPVYEYLVMVYQWETSVEEWSEQQKHFARLGYLAPSEAPQRIWRGTFHIWRPNAINAEQRPAEGVSLATIFNEFGREGWKLVATDIPDSAVSDSYLGWTEAGVAITQRWTFIREARS